MQLVKAVSKSYTRLHWIDGSKYSKVRRAKALCGLKGKHLWVPLSVWFGGAPFCKRCKSKEEEG